MKKFIAIFLCFVLFGLAGKAHCKDNIVFIYLNGSNTNTIESKTWFYKGIAKLHKEISSQFTQDEFVKKQFLKDGKYKISSEPVVIYWGDKSQAEIKQLEEDINYMKLFSPKIAQFARKYIALCLHDAIWISKYPNMAPILDELHKKILSEQHKGNKVVLMGYSAGTFITYQYYLLRLPSINMDKLVKHSKLAKHSADLTKSLNLKNTCLAALFESGLVTYDLKGALVLEDNSTDFKEKITKIDRYSNMYCAPTDSIAGVINYASPIILFYSDLADPKYEVTRLNALSYKYVIENDLFWLTVNYADDPMGFPTTKNLNISDVEEKTGFDIDPHLGFYYEKSDVSSGRTFAAAHTSYWNTSKKFAKTIVKAYKEGYEYFHKTPDTNINL